MTADETPSPALRGVFFDFDGVLLESAGIKTDAFRDLFSDLAELLPRILEHHRQHLGVSRFRKFEWVHRELLGRPLSDAERVSLGERYSELVLRRMLTCPEVPGARELLSALAGRALRFVVSATPQEELELIVDRRGLAPYFDEVRGSPEVKESILRDLLHSYDLRPEETVMIGDGVSDYRAARKAGVGFVLRETVDQEDYFRDVETPRAADLHAVAVLLEARLTC